MSTVVSGSLVTNTEPRVHHAKPGFFRLMGGELFKIHRQISTWIMVILLVVVILGPFAIVMVMPRTEDALKNSSYNFLSLWIYLNLLLVRSVTGFMLIIMTARSIGQEYNLGTIRVLLARGVGRVQLLLAKLAALVVWALIILLISLALNALLTSALVFLKTGSLDAFTSMNVSSSALSGPGQQPVQVHPFWQDVGTYIGTLGISMGATILLATAFSVLGRSLAFGLTLSLIWFPADNILTLILAIVFQITHDDLWRNITAYLYGPNLNAMVYTFTNRPDWNVGILSPLISIDVTHLLFVIIAYAVFFLILAIVLTWRRDVKE